jgi:alkaline phosphatase
MMGGARDHWTPAPDGGGAGRPDGRDLLAELAGLATSPYRVVHDKAEFDAVNPAETTRLVGIFTAAGHMNYELDRKKQAPASEPSLGEMTQKAIEVLRNASAKSGSKGFFLMVEGGRIDHALHSTNAKRALEDTIAFDDAIQVALGAVDLKDTLVVVTADHDHTMAINGYPVRTGPTTASNPGILGTARYADGTDRQDGDALPYTILAFGNGFRRPDLRGVDDLKVHLAHLDATTKQELTLNAGTTISGPFETTGGTDHDNYLQVVGVALGDPGSETHGGGDVMLMADGAGASAFKGTLDNTRVFALMRKAFGL